MGEKREEIRKIIDKTTGMILFDQHNRTVFCGGVLEGFEHIEKVRNYQNGETLENVLVAPNGKIAAMGVGIDERERLEEIARKWIDGAER